MSFFDVHNSWNEYVVRNHETKAVRILMATLIHLNNKNRNRGFETTDRDLRDMSELSFGSIITARRRLMELGFVECDASAEAPRRGSRYKLVAKIGAKIEAKIGAKSGAKSPDGGRHDAENPPPKKLKKGRKEKETYKEKESPKVEEFYRVENEPDFEAYADALAEKLAKEKQAANEPEEDFPRAKDEPDFEAYADALAAKLAKEKQAANEPEEDFPRAKDEPDFEAYADALSSKLAKERQAANEAPFEPEDETDLEAEEPPPEDEPDFESTDKIPTLYESDWDDIDEGGTTDDECRIFGESARTVAGAGGDLFGRDEGLAAGGVSAELGAVRAECLNAEPRRRALDAGTTGGGTCETAQTSAEEERHRGGNSGAAESGGSSAGGAVSKGSTPAEQKVWIGHRVGQVAAEKVNRRRTKIRSLRKMCGKLLLSRGAGIRDVFNQRDRGSQLGAVPDRGQAARRRENPEEVCR
ncbi:MAG: hypothetical protein IKI76_01165 [Selenomonadaceae bacterium]|nr:hypothetical protein [Selenomonadaceae bacterium]